MALPDLQHPLYPEIPMDADERSIVDDFYTDPLLGGLHGAFLYYASKELDAMPRPRFGQHDPDYAFTNHEFVARFGIDTSHRMHPIRQHHVLARLISHGFEHLDEDGRKSLELAAVVHDFGEPFSKDGDVILGGAKDEDAETAARHEAIRAISPRHAEEIIERTEPILADRTSQPGEIFYISELIGYCLTGKRAGIVYLEGHRTGLTPDQRTVAGTIATNVLYNTLPRLERYCRVNLAAGLTALETTSTLTRVEKQFALESPSAYQAATDAVRHS